MGRLILIGGGARSGKSRFAQSWAEAAGPRRLLLATAEARDTEMAERIARHRSERDAAWTTVEAPVDLPGALRTAAPADAAVVDCCTLWLSNRLLRGDAPDAILAALDDVVGAAVARPHDTAVVTNEVGLGIVPDEPLTRTFRDLAGRAHQQLAAAAAAVYFAALGSVLRLRPGPVTCVCPEAPA